MKKVLIITYYWPPAGGTGTQRCLKFAKHLHRYGWEPVIYTASNRNELQTDDSLNKTGIESITVLETKAWDPYRPYRFFTGRSKSEAVSPHLAISEKTGLRERFSRWVRDNIFIPDARKFWIKPSVRFLSEYIAKNKIDLVFTSGPPHSMHLIGLGLKKQNPELKWVVDFRDPWMHIHSYHEASLTGSAMKKQFRLEREVLASANAVIAIGNQLRDELMQHSGQNASGKFHTITNSFEKLRLPHPQRNGSKFIITHSGTLYKNRSPLVLWQTIAALTRSNPAFRERLEIKLIGKVEIETAAAMSSCGLDPFIRKTGFLNHEEAQKEMLDSDLLLVLVNDVPQAGGILTGKFFEYLGSGLPILAIGPNEGDLAEIIRETNCGTIVNFRDAEKMKESLLLFFKGNFKTNPAANENYSAEKATGKLAGIFNELRTDLSSN